jgi:hypothetical protein
MLQHVEEVPVTEAAHKATGGRSSAPPPRARYASAEIRQPRSFRRSPKPYLATAHVPRDANNATMIPDGMIARGAPSAAVGDEIRPPHCTDAAYKAISAMLKDKLRSVVCFEPLVVG